MTANSHPLRVFLCYATTDEPPVHKLYKRLVGDGIEAWLDKEKLVPGLEWKLEIAKAVQNSDAVIICLSNRSVTKEGFVQKEIKFALDVADEKPEGTIFIIPARLEECDVPQKLRKFQWVDLFSVNGYDWLLKALETRAKDVDAILVRRKVAAEYETSTEIVDNKIYRFSMANEVTRGLLEQARTSEADKQAIKRGKHIRWVVEVVGFMAILVTMAIINLNYYLLGLLLLFVTAVRAAAYRSDTNEKHLDIQIQLMLIYYLCSFEKEAEVRCAFHVPDMKGRLLQATAFIPTGTGKGRIFSTNKGIIGKAYIQKMPIVQNFYNYDEYRDKMTKDYGFSLDEIRSIATDRRSYLCLPLINEANQKVLGLAQFDSSQAGFFTSMDDPKVKNIHTMLQLIRGSIVQ